MISAPVPARRAAAPLALLAAVGVLATLLSCGGGVVGGGGTGVQIGQATGTVNGFGSVIVDGVAFDTAAALVVSETTPGVQTLAEVKLGDRVTVEYDASSVASTVHVEPALAGVITSLGAGGTLTILGQTVDVVVDPAIGPLTQFGGGYAQAADLRAGDAVEVHGPIVQQGTSSYHVQATRIAKLAATPTYLRVTGLVSALGGSTGYASFQLAGLSVAAGTAPVLPSGSTLANGQTVTVLAAASAWSGSGSVPAAQIRIDRIPDGGLDNFVSGYVSHFDASSATFVLGGQSVAFAGAAVSPTNLAIADGEYVQVRGRVDADGRLSASAVVIRTTTSNESELRGTVSAYDATTQAFVVRGTAVDASAASVKGCPATGLSNGAFVEVHGTLGSAGVVASTIECESESSASTVEREGTASAVDVTASTFTLTSETGTATPVRWTSSTYFGLLTPQTLSGRKIQVEGSIIDGVLVASHIDSND